MPAIQTYKGRNTLFLVCPPKVVTCLDELRSISSERNLTLGREMAFVVFSCN